MGRPTTALSDQLSVRITVRFTEREAAMLAQDAAATGRTVSGCLRDIAIGTVDLSRTGTLSSADAAAFIRSLAPIGSNLLQIARSSNSPDATNSARIALAVEELSSILATIRAAL